MPDVSLSATDEIVIGAEGMDEIIQNVRLILATPRGSVPLDRDFGVSWHFVDLSTPMAQAEIATEIFEQVTKYEPRVKISEVFWDDGGDPMEGVLKPGVRIEILESVNYRRKVLTSDASPSGVVTTGVSGYGAGLYGQIPYGA